MSKGINAEDQAQGGTHRNGASYELFILALTIFSLIMVVMILFWPLSTASKAVLFRVELLICGIFLADFVSPKKSSVPDFLGAFAVTAGIGLDALVRRFEEQHDDYQAIMAKALADRLVEAFAEHLHARARLSGFPGPYGKGDAV